MTDDELRALEPFDSARLAELTRRAETMQDATDRELSAHLLLSHDLYEYYISETTDYLEAAVKEASKRLLWSRLLGG